MEATSFQGQRPVWWWSPASTATFLLAAGGVLLLFAARRRWLGVPLLALAVIVAIPIVRTGQDAFIADPGSQALVCDRFETLEVCLFQVHRGQLDEVAAGLAPVLTGLYAQVRMVEGAGSEAAPEIGLNSLYVGPTLTSGPDLTVLRSDLATGLMRWGCAAQTPFGADYTAPQAVLEAAYYPLYAWLAGRTDGPPDPRDVGGLTDAQLVAVTRAYRAAAAACDEPAALGALAPLTPP